MKFGLRLLPVFGLSLVLQACGDRETSSFGGLSGILPAQEAPVEDLTAEQIFARGEALLNEGEAEDAAQAFSEVERLFPYSDWSRRAALRQTFAYNRAKDYEQSRGAAQRFLDFYPADPEAARAHYMIALSYYDQIDTVSRDQGIAFQALQGFRTVIENYPDSEFVNPSLLKFDLALDHLAGKEMEIVRFYLKRKHPGAAINRFRAVVEDFQTTSHTAEALHRLVESYLILGLRDEAQTAGAILGHNYRSTDWYEDSYTLLTEAGIDPEKAARRGDGWLTKVYRQVLSGKWI